MGLRAHAPELNAQERSQVLFGQCALIAEQSGMDIRKLFRQHQQLFVRKRLQADDRRQHVHQTLLREPPLRQARTQRFVAVDPAPSVFDGLRRAAHDDA